MRVILSPRALDDLAEIGAYIEYDNPARASSFVGELRQACSDLGDFPRRYPSYPDLGPKARRRTYGNYVIIYDVTEQVDVVAVVHTARNLIDLL